MFAGTVFYSFITVAYLTGGFRSFAASSTFFGPRDLDFFITVLAVAMVFMPTLPAFLSAGTLLE